MLAVDIFLQIRGHEVIQKAKAAEVETATPRADLEALGLALAPFTSSRAKIAAELWQSTRNLGLSLGDRACLALGLDTDRYVTHCGSECYAERRAK